MDYYVTEVDGWLESPDSKDNAQSSEMAPGEFPTPWSYKARLIEINGIAICRDYAGQSHVIDQLKGLAAVRREWMTVQGLGTMRSALVRKIGKPFFSMGINGVLKWGLQFKAEDPRLYGDQKRINLGYDNTFIGHMGNFPAAPLIRLRCQGMDDGFTVRAVVGGETRIWRYAYSSTAGKLHEIDLSTGRHLVGADGIERSSRVTRFDIWDIPPHERIPVRVRPINDVDEFSLAEVIYRDTWM